MNTLACVELSSMRYFREIAQHGHITRAAHALGVTQPALSAMVRKLEEELGTPLLHRTGKGVALTEAGQLFLTHVENALREADQASRSVRQLMGLERGTIRVGSGATVVTYILPPVVLAVRKRHPSLHFSIREAGSTQVAEAVVRGELDLGIVTLPLTLAGREELLTIPLVKDELRLIFPADAKALKGAGSFRWKDIAGMPVVGFEGGSAVRAVIDQAAAKAGVTLNYVMELRSIESIKSMVEAGIGIGFVSRFALRSDQGIVCKDADLSRTLAIVRRRDRVPNPAAAEFERSLLASVKPAPGKRRAN